MSVKHLTQLDLARRWSISPRSLERYRWTGVGSAYVKLRGRILYRLTDIETFEAERLQESTTRKQGGVR
jgi:hypothetical protein